MALATNIEDLLNKQKIESNRIEFKKGWNPANIYHCVCAFANDFDDLGGGYIIIGVDTDEKTGMAIRPVEGLPLEKIDKILQEMVGYNNKLSPYYLPRTSVEEVDGKHVLVIWCPAGINRPYSVPENITTKKSTKEYFYIRSGTSSIIARGEVLDELRALVNRVPFDERGNNEIKEIDISLILLRDYLVKVGSKLANEVTSSPIDKILDQMELYTGPKENRLIRNVAAMMFCENPSKFFPYTQIDVVTFPNGGIKDPNNFTEITFKGSVLQMIKQCMDYIKSNVLKECVRKIPGQQEAERFWNYPYDAIEEAVVNACYHRDFSQREPIEITIEPDSISILNCPGPDHSISKEAIEKGDMLKSRRYRNRRLGDFLKELDLTEGRSTGIPTIQTKLAENGSPRATFETTDDRLTLLVTIPIHKGCAESIIPSAVSSERGSKSSERSSESSERSSKSSERILELIRNTPTLSAAEIAMQLDMSSRGVEKQIKKLREAGIIRRVGADFGGYWQIVGEEDN